jgi:tetratricopeptide (TPR) repeat protein
MKKFNRTRFPLKVGNDNKKNKKSKNALFFQKRKTLLFCLISFLSTNVIPGFERESKSSSIFNVLTQKKAHDAYQAGDFAQAQSAYTELLTANPYDAQNNYNLGCTLHKQKKFEDAQNYFNRAIEYATPDSKLQEQSLFNRGNNFAAQKKWDEAIADYKKVLKMNPNNESAKKNLKACEQMKQKEKKQEQQQKDKNKKKDQDKDQKDQQQKQDSSDQQSGDESDEKNQSSDQQSGNESDQNDQSSNQKKDQQGNQKKSSNGKPKDQKGDQEKEGKEKEESKQEQADGLKKSKNQQSKDQKDREKQEKKDSEHKKSSEKSAQKQSTDSDKVGKEKSDDQGVELNDAYAQEMMGKPSDDDRLEKRSAMLLEKLDDYEKNIQKKLLQMNVTKQGAQKHGQKNW